MKKDFRSEKTIRLAKIAKLLKELNNNKVLANHTNGFVYLSNKREQVKINIGKRRNGRNFKFSHPQYWRVLNTFEGWLVKLGLYKFVKIK